VIYRAVYSRTAASTGKVSEIKLRVSLRDSEGIIVVVPILVLSTVPSMV